MSLSPLCWRTLDDDCCQLSRSYGASAIGADRLEIDAARLAVAVGAADLDAAGVVRRVLDLEEGIAPHRVLHFLGEVERGKLQQAHRVLQPRRDGVLLPLSRLQGREIHRSIRFERVGKEAAQRGATTLPTGSGSNTRATAFAGAFLPRQSALSRRVASGRARRALRQRLR